MDGRALAKHAIDFWSLNCRKVERVEGLTLRGHGHGSSSDGSDDKYVNGRSWRVGAGLPQNRAILHYARARDFENRGLFRVAEMMHWSTACTRNASRLL